jgi:hypothetical protein
MRIVIYYVRFICSLLKEYFGDILMVYRVNRQRYLTALISFSIVNSHISI